MRNIDVMRIAFSLEITFVSPTSSFSSFQIDAKLLFAAGLFNVGFKTYKWELLEKMRRAIDAVAISIRDPARQGRLVFHLVRFRENILSLRVNFRNDLLRKTRILHALSIRFHSRERSNHAGIEVNVQFPHCVKKAKVDVGDLFVVHRRRRHTIVNPFALEKILVFLLGNFKGRLRHENGEPVVFIAQKGLDALNKSIDFRLVNFRANPTDRINQGEFLEPKRVNHNFAVVADEIERHVVAEDGGRRVFCNAFVSDKARHAVDPKLQIEILGRIRVAPIPRSAGFVDGGVLRASDSESVDGKENKRGKKNNRAAYSQEDVPARRSMRATRTLARRCRRCVSSHNDFPNPFRFRMIPKGVATPVVVTARRERYRRAPDTETITWEQACK